MGMQFKNSSNSSNLFSKYLKVIFRITVENYTEPMLTKY